MTTPAIQNALLDPEIKKVPEAMPSNAVNFASTLTPATLTITDV